ncbi:hypothetical protein [Sphingomonas lenta]|uniref:Uncharacterized protein n=1 Tax=Sphingomonas lenta TaxID=1141887 RepID=A0A2A2SCE0_9SPHN|nr:hypothetical protein [Sphingomonas lenta]PAX06842.1 hypothetical protein CKY28_12225 [Sphingomonas lenta]
MEPVYFILAIMGCGDGQAACQEQRVEPVRYETAAECRAAMPVALQRHTDIDFPVVSAACRASGPVMVKNEVKRPRG